jgi:hypothetical protein
MPQVETGGGDCDVFVVYPGASIMACLAALKIFHVRSSCALDPCATVTNVVSSARRLSDEARDRTQTTGRLHDGRPESVR